MDLCKYKCLTVRTHVTPWPLAAVRACTHEPSICVVAGPIEQTHGWGVLTLIVICKYNMEQVDIVKHACEYYILEIDVAITNIQ